jgi:DNA-binding CsgD family transcriptional regulator
MGRFLRRRIKDIRTIPPEILSLRISSNTNREIGLTQRQETFARYVAGGNMTYAEAAKLSGFKGKWVKRYGYMLMNPKLFQRWWSA